MNYVQVLNQLTTPKPVPGCVWTGWGFEINKDSFYVINTLIVCSTKKEFQVRIPKKQLMASNIWLKAVARRKCNIAAHDAIQHMVYQLGIYLK